MLSLEEQADLAKRTELLGMEKQSQSHTPQLVCLTIKQGGAVSPNCASCRAVQNQQQKKPRVYKVMLARLRGHRYAHTLLVDVILAALEND